MLKRNMHRYVVVGLLLAMMGVLTGVFSPGQSDTDMGVITTEVHLPVMVTTLVLYALLLWRVLSNPGRYLQSLSRQWVLLPLLAYCLASASWSSDPSLTFRRALVLALTVTIGVVIGTDFDVSELGRMVSAANLLHLAICAVFFVVARHYLFAPEDPVALKGLTTHKNVFGFEQGLAVLTLWFCPFRKWKVLRLPLTLIAAGALLWSHSSGAMVATVAALSLAPLLSVSRLPMKQRVPAAAIVMVIAAGLFALVSVNLERIPALFSKDATLTGRTELWSLVLVAIRSRPLLGFGFDSFWRGLEGDSLTIIRSVGWLVPTAHNGYLDLLLSVGIIGAVLFAVPMAVFVWRSLQSMGQSSESSRLFPAVLLIFLTVYNLNESALLTRSGLPFFLIVALGTAMTGAHRQLAAYRAGKRFQSFQFHNAATDVR